jgi:hypothetical protein
LEDAGNHITKLPKTEHEAAKWQAAMEALILVVTLGGATMFARIAPVRFFTIEIEHALDVAIQSPQHADARVHQWPALLSRHDQRFRRGLPFGEVLFGRPPRGESTDSPVLLTWPMR